MADETFSQAAIEILPNEIWFLIFDKISTYITCPILPKYNSDDWRFAWIYPFLILTSKELKSIAQQYVKSNHVSRTHIPYIDFTAFMALQGSLSCVKYLSQLGYPFTRKTTACAAFNGSVEILKFLNEEVQTKWSKRTCDMAAKSGNLAALQYVHSIGCSWTVQTCAEAATSSLACLKYAHDNGCQWDGNTTCNAAHSDKLDCLTYAFDRGCPWDSRTTMFAASANSFPCFKYAIKNGCPVDEMTYKFAAMSGSIQCLQYLLDTYPDKPYVGQSIVVKDNMEAIKFAHEKGLITWTAAVCESASTHGSINALKYARQNKCPWNTKTANHAGNLTCLQYALENGCPYTPAEVCANAVKRGDLAMLRFAVEFGCQWDLNALCTEAHMVNDIDMVRYIHEKSGSKWPAGLRSTNRKVLSFMHRHECPWDIRQTEILAEIGSLELLKYVHKRGCPWSPVTCTMAAKGGYLSCLKYAHENGAAWDQTTLNEAIRNEELQCVDYIKRHK